MSNNLIIAMHQNPRFINELKCYIPKAFTVIEKQKVQAILQETRINQVLCIVLHVEHALTENTQFEQFKKGFSYIPCIAVINTPNIELARYCGSIGIESVLLYEKMSCIKEEIIRICSEKDNKVSLKELSINKNDSSFSAIIKEALSFIEKDYIKILNINEIADIIEINESTLSREFTKYNLPGPKKILMFLKIRHAIKLMQNKKLNIREISSLSGFTDEKRMAECFHRMFGMPPGEYRSKQVKTINIHLKW